MAKIIPLIMDVIVSLDKTVPQAITKHNMAGNLAIAMLWIVQRVVRGISHRAIIPLIESMIACIIFLAGRMAIARKMVCDALILHQNQCPKI